MPAAAVIPAPIAYINVVAVKKLVVGFWACLAGHGEVGLALLPPSGGWGVDLPLKTPCRGAAVVWVGLWEAASSVLQGGHVPGVPPFHLLCSHWLGLPLLGCRGATSGPQLFFLKIQGALHRVSWGFRTFTLKKLECSKQAPFFA